MHLCYLFDFFIIKSQHVTLFLGDIRVIYVFIFILSKCTHLTYLKLSSYSGL